MKNIKPKSPEIPEIIFIVPLISTFFQSSWCYEKSSFGKERKIRWQIHKTLAIKVNAIAHHIHKNHITNPLSTETIQKAIPFATQSIPFALSRCSLSKSKVIIVDIVIIRIFQTMTQNKTATAKNHKYGLEIVWNTYSEAEKYIPPARKKKKKEAIIEESIMSFFLWWSTNAQKNTQETKTLSKYIHPINEVTIIDFFSKYPQKESANHIKLFATEHKKVFPKRWKKSLFFQ